MFRSDLAVGTKDGKTDYVTEADRRAQSRVVEVIRDADPDGAIVGEEGDRRKTVPAAGPAWIIDPIDGTKNYVRGLPLWATAVAAVDGGRPIAAAIVAPKLGHTFTASADTAWMDGDTIRVSERRDPEAMTVAPTYWWPMDRREEYGAAASNIVERFGDLIRLGSAQLTLALVARGAIDATLTNRRMNPWDSVAGAFLVEVAGGTVTDIDGSPWHHDSPGLVASNGTAHETAVAAAQAIRSGH